MTQSVSVYSGLDLGSRQIRLLKLLAGEESTICAELKVASLDDLPRYEALSYVWGQSDETSTIQLENDTFVVTPNLHSALRHLRRKDEDQLLWIDAICLYVDRYQRNYHRNLRFRPLFSEGFRFSYPD
jgi:hypothetical protein